MTKQILKPLTLVAAIAVSFGAFAETAPRSSIDKATLDSKINPCQDFFGYVNGIPIKKTPIPADRTSWGTFEQLDERSQAQQRTLVETAMNSKAAPGSVEQKVGDFYASGSDEAAIEKAGFTPIKDDLKRIDGLKTPDDIVALIRDTAVRGGNDNLFFFGAFPDFKNSDTMIAYTGQAGTNLPERDYYLNESAESKKLRDAYVAHITRMLQLIGTPAADAATQSQQILALETRLAKVQLSALEQRDPANQYHPISFADADKLTPHISWEKFFATMNTSGINSFSMSPTKFFGELDAMLTEVPIAQWQAYFRYHTADAAAPYLSKAFVNENFAFFSTTMRGQKEIKPRWKRVLDETSNDLGEPLGQLYVAKNFPPESKTRALELVNNLREALKIRIEKLDWMSAETKKKALEKWGTFVAKIGYPDHWRDYSGVTITRDNYFANVTAVNKFNQAFNVAKIGKPVDRSEWGMTPQTVNAQYNPLSNDITFPAAILQPPFFDAKADDALNYGAIGAVIGHEMTHGYDDQGAQFDAKGNFKNWWTDADQKDFKARTDKLVKQFDDYVAIDNLHVKGALTLGENIADLGGINTAFDALHAALAKKPQGPIDGLTQDQRFFLAFAHVWARQFRPEEAKLRLNTDVHAPAQFRAIASPSNMPAFAQSFQCKAGDAMVRGPDTQVKIW